MTNYILVDSLVVEFLLETSIDCVNDLQALAQLGFGTMPTSMLTIGRLRFLVSFFVVVFSFDVYED